MLKKLISKINNFVSKKSKATKTSTNDENKCDVMDNSKSIINTSASEIKIESSYRIFNDAKKNGILLDSNACINNNGLLTENVGVRISDASIAPFAKKGEAYPASGSYTFSTTENQQDQITLSFHRSSQNITSKETFIGMVRIKGYQLEPAREPFIRVYYEINNNQILIWAINEKNNGTVTLTLVKNFEDEYVH